MDWGTAPAKLVTADLKTPETAKNQRREMITPKSKICSFRPCWKKFEKGLRLKLIQSKISKDPYLQCSHFSSSAFGFCRKFQFINPMSSFYACIEFTSFSYK